MKKIVVFGVLLVGVTISVYAAGVKKKSAFEKAKVEQAEVDARKSQIKVDSKDLEGSLTKWHQANPNATEIEKRAALGAHLDAIPGYKELKPTDAMRGEIAQSFQSLTEISGSGGAKKLRSLPTPPAHGFQISKLEDDKAKEETDRRVNEVARALETNAGLKKAIQASDDLKDDEKQRMIAFIDDGKFEKTKAGENLDEVDSVQRLAINNFKSSELLRAKLPPTKVVTSTSVLKKGASQTKLQGSLDMDFESTKQTAARSVSSAKKSDDVELMSSDKKRAEAADVEDIKEGRAVDIIKEKGIAVTKSKPTVPKLDLSNVKRTEETESTKRPSPLPKAIKKDLQGKNKPADRKAARSVADKVRKGLKLSDDDYRTMKRVLAGVGITVAVGAVLAAIFIPLAEAGVFDEPGAAPTPTDAPTTSEPTYTPTQPVEEQPEETGMEVVAGRGSYQFED